MVAEKADHVKNRFKLKYETKAINGINRCYSKWRGHFDL